MKTIAIVGRPNVGKSTLYNRLLKMSRAIVHDEPGVTRDPLISKFMIGERKLWLVDTGGYVPGKDVDDMQKLVDSKIEDVVKTADLILVVMDGREGITPVDREFLSQLRKFGKQALGVINKIDPGAKATQSPEFFELGLKSIVEISAEHGLGIEDLKDQVISSLPQMEEETESQEEGLKVAFVGRPNVGKSSIINCILKEPRLIVSEQAGTTRDVIDVALEKDGKKYLLLDTAGIRRRHKVVDSVEHFSVVRALRATERADVVVLVLDATQKITSQDERIASAILAKGRGLLIAVNKWDLLKDTKNLRSNFREDIYLSSPFLKFAALKFVSAKNGVGVDQLLVEAWRIFRRRKKLFSDHELKPIFESILSHESSGGLRLMSLTQAQHEKEMTFFVWCNDPRRVPTNYDRYFKNALSAFLQLEGVPIRLIFRRRSAKALREARETPKARSRRPSVR